MKNRANLPLLSIIIPAFNRQEQLNILIKTICEGGAREELSRLVEIIVIDDYSESPILIDDCPIAVLVERNQKNIGAPFSRLKGFKLSKGQFVHFHDSDDSISTDWFKAVFAVLKKSPQLDILMTGRIDVHELSEVECFQKYFHKYHANIAHINQRLMYRNCLGPLGGVTFSRRVLENIEFKNFASCQDWQMYIDVMKHAKVLVSRPDIKFIFNKTGDDRISHNPRKKILGHLQLAKITGKKSIFGRHIRLFYLYTCKQHIYNKGGYILKFYKKNRLSIFITFLVVSVYWRIT